MCHPFLLFFPRISLRINIFHTLRSSKITKHQARLPGFQASRLQPGPKFTRFTRWGVRGVRSLAVTFSVASCKHSKWTDSRRREETVSIERRTEETKYGEIHWKYIRNTESFREQTSSNFQTVRARNRAARSTPSSCATFWSFRQSLNKFFQNLVSISSLLGRHKQIR